eukprot:m.220415 g.220415  ORF g.220415 m.220415 type:complete len:580 (+) comp25784_c0_seq1:50-1789(+)
MSAPTIVGVLGGGQLGRMLAESAHNMPHLTVLPLDPLGPDSPAGQVASNAVKGSFKDAAAVRELAAQCNVITAEIEHVNCDVLDELVAEGIVVRPSPTCIRLIQDKLRQKLHFAANDVAVGPFADIVDAAAAVKFGELHGFPYMLKARLGAYDGKGNCKVDSAAECAAAFASMGGNGSGGCYAEKWCAFTTEIAVMVLNAPSLKEPRCFPVVDFTSVSSILFSTRCPAELSVEMEAKARQVAIAAVKCLPDESYGVFGVEMFALTSGKIVLNEVAPRVHNTGHYTIEACGVSQFDAHLLAVADKADGSGPDLTELDLGLRVGAATMVNMVQGNGFPDGIMDIGQGVKGATLHWYGKAEVRPGRKMAHITVCGPSHSAIQTALATKHPKVAELAYPKDLMPWVGVIMGSTSDLPTMEPAVAILREFGIPHEVTVVSAHRTPDRLCRYAREAAGRGLRVIIAGAGGAAHLPGMVAAMTPLPVIGVPVKTSALSGVDSLYSIVQMPGGVPVATVAIGNAKNAGILACEIIGGGGRNADVLAKRAAMMEASRVEVEAKAAELEELGAEGYLAKHSELRSKTVM